MDARSCARTLKPLLQVGKNGLSDAFIAELRLLLDKRRVVKVRLLRSFADAHETKGVANLLAERLSCVVVDVVGNTFTLGKR